MNIILSLLAMLGLGMASRSSDSETVSNSERLIHSPEADDPPDEAPAAPEEVVTDPPAEEPVGQTDQDEPAEEPAEEPVDQAGQDEPAEEPAEEPEVASTVPVFLMDTRNGEVLTQLTNGMELSGDFVNDPNLSVVFIPEDGSGAESITFSYGDITRTETNAPYALFGDTADGVTGGVLFDDAGGYSLTLEVFDGPNGTGNTIAIQEISLAVAEPEVVVTEVTAPPAEDPIAEDEPADDPTVEEPVEEPEEEVDRPSVADPNPLPSGANSGDNDNTGEIVGADNSVDVLGGRVTTLAPEGNDIASVRILSETDNGTITVNPDNTLALVLTKSDFTGQDSFRYEVTHSDGSTSVQNVSLNVEAGPQDAGWGTGESHYMLETDEDDRVVVEHGENHTKVYVSASNDALSIAEIAAMEGVSASTITGGWLEDHPEYGRSEGTALAEDAATLLWNELTPRGSESSHWLLLERGYQYDDLLVEAGANGAHRLIGRDVHGESELNPIYIGAWGEGDRPELTERFIVFQETSSNIVIQDIHFGDAMTILNGENILFDNILTTGNTNTIQEGAGITIRNSQVYDSARDTPSNGSYWTGSDRKQGLYAENNDGLLIEGSLFDRNGWAEGYDPDGNGSSPMTPNLFNHNLYIDAGNLDVTFRDTITMRASSYGIQVRSGGFIEDNLLLDNNAGISFYGGDYYGNGAVGNYTLAVDNVITSAAHKESTYSGALTWGINDQAQLTSMVDNIITHLADPNNPEPWKTITQEPLQSEDPYFNDTIIYNWAVEFEPWRGPDENAEGLDTNVLDQTTIQLFTAQLLGTDNATISDLADYLRAQAEGAFEDVVDADLIIQFFQTGFGIAPDLRETEATLRFVPNELGDGVRWDNRLNWDTDDLPGTQDGDSVDLAGNHVIFGADTTVIDKLDFGDGGALNIYGSKLTVTGGFEGEDADLDIEGAGQLWIDGSDATDVDIDILGGRFVNTGNFQSGGDLTASGGQTVLASDDATYQLGSSDTLAIFDAAAKVGFDGEDGGLAILDLEEGSTVEYSAQSGDLGNIEEFRSGAFGDNPDVQSGIDLGDSTLSLNLSGLSANAGNSFTLMSADEIVGLFDDAVVGGLGSRNANIVIDYLTDSVTLELSSGNGAVSIETVGEESDVSDGQDVLWNALTSGQGVFSETASADLEEDPLDTAA